jgi:uncharacterized protein (UPF0248 family)
MTEMFEKEIIEKDVLNRLKWDQKLNITDFSMLYEDRFKINKLVEIRISDINYLGGDFFTIIEKDEDDNDKTSEIPLHRIRQFRHNGKIVWNKRRNKQ